MSKNMERSILEAMAKQVAEATDEKVEFLRRLSGDATSVAEMLPSHESEQIAAKMVGRALESKSFKALSQRFLSSFADCAVLLGMSATEVSAEMARAAKRSKNKASKKDPGEGDDADADADADGNGSELSSRSLTKG